MTDLDLKNTLNAAAKGEISLEDIIITDKEKCLTGEEAFNYLKWGIKHGFKLLSEMPEYETINSIYDRKIF